MLYLKDLSLENNTNINKVLFKETEIEVLSYLPIEEKASIVSLAIQEGKDEKGILHRVVSDAIFTLFAIVHYSNISLTDSETENFSETYDLLEKNGVIDTVINAIPEEEYSCLVESYESAIETYNTYRNSAAGGVENFFKEIPSIINGMDSALNEFDPSKLGEIQNILSVVGGNQDAVANTVLGQK